MDISSFWWIAAGVLVGLELATGTFYLLMLALGMAAAAIAAFLGLSPSAQISIAALIGTGSAVGLYTWRRTRSTASLVADQSQNSLDQGHQVQVTPEGLTALGATVHYRGANWQARSATGTPLQAGCYTILRVDGSQLVVEPIAHPPVISN